MSRNIHFHHHKTWENYDSSGSIKTYKVPAVLRNIPKDVNNILDVGCGNGIITNILNETYDIVGVDISAKALEQVKGEIIECSSGNIPVQDNSFDLVLSSQLLEHLSDNLLNETLSEFKRISKKYILITVPNEEFLKKNETKCPECNNIFNVNGHYQSFSTGSITKLLGEDLILINEEKTGRLHKEYNRTLMQIRQEIGNRYFNPISHTACPNCANTEFPYVKGNVTSKLMNGINRVISTKKPYWLVLLFEMKTNL